MKLSQNFVYDMMFYLIFVNDKLSLIIITNLHHQFRRKHDFRQMNGSLSNHFEVLTLCSSEKMENVLALINFK